MSTPHGPDEGTSQEVPRVPPDVIERLRQRELVKTMEELEEQRRKNERARSTNAVQADVQSVMKNVLKHALNITVQRVTDPATAPRFSARHNVHVRTEQIADSMFRAYNESGQAKLDGEEDVELQRLGAEDDGLFVFRDDDAFMEQRIVSRYPDGRPEYLMVEASGSHPRPDHPRHGKVLPAADAQIHLPEARHGAVPVFSAPDASRTPIADQITRKELLDIMLERPQTVAQLDDIVSDPDMGRLGLASRAFQEALRILVEDMNPDRGTFAVEHITAEIVSIRGLLLHSGHELFFDEEIPGTPILNGHSWVWFDHFKSQYVSSFRLAWSLENRLIPVMNHPYVKSLIGSWYVKAARVKKPQS